jgi:predicted nucleic acid-binding protein
VRIVLDTNILIGVLITRNTPPDQLYQAWQHSRNELVTSPAQIDEFTAVVARPRLRPYIAPG